MDPRGPLPRGARALGVVASAVLASAIAQPVGRAQPAPAPSQPREAPTAADLTRARDLYQAAEAAMKEGRFADAVRDYDAAHELSKDPALLFKLGRAHERAGACEVALTYYARYLREGAPSEPFTATTHERIRACGGEPPALAEPEPSEPTPAGSGAGSAAAGAGAQTGGEAAPSPRTGNAETGAAPTVVPAGVPAPSTSHKVAWLVTGSAVALATLGGVLAYAASSSENEVRDLYVGFGGQPPVFDAQTRKKYDELIDQGRRYEHLSWASFGLAGAAAVGAAVLFSIGRRDEATPKARVAPVVTTRTAGVAISF